MIVNLNTVRNSLVFSLCDSILHLDSIQDLARPRIRALIDSDFPFCSQQRRWDGRRRHPRPRAGSSHRGAAALPSAWPVLSSDPIHPNVGEADAEKDPTIGLRDYAFRTS